VTLSQIQQEAVALTERERIDLVRTLLDTLPPAGTDVSDEEVTSREREMESGQVEPLSHEEFVRRVQKERGQ
jgi:putative addiction module component (TIGR02574 family)